MPVGIERERRIVDAGIELRRNVDELHAAGLQERDALAQLGVAADLDAERHAGRVLGKAERAPELPRKEADAVVLRPRAQEHASRPAIGGLLALHEAEVPGVEGLRPGDVGDEQAHRPDLGDLERARQQHALHVEGLGERLPRPVTREDVDALVERLGDLCDLGHLGKRGLLAEAAIVHLGRLAELVPADLLDAVVKLDRVAVRIVDVHVPVAPRHVPSHALDGDALVLEIGVGVHDLPEAAALPGDLVDGHLGRELPVGAVIQHFLVEQDEGMVVRAVAHEVAACVAEVVALGSPRHLPEVEDVGMFEAEEVPVEVTRLVHPNRVEAEVAEPPDLERSSQQHSADVEAIPVRRHRQVPPRVRGRFVLVKEYRPFSPRPSRF